MATTCPHGLAGGACLICQTLAPGRAGERRPAAAPTGAAVASRRSRLVPSAVGGLVVLAVAVVLAGWALAAVGAVLRILQLVAVAILAGWAGWRLGVRHGRRTGS